MSEPDWAGGEPYSDAFREKVRARIVCLTGGHKCARVSTVPSSALAPIRQKKRKI
ncbi:hypothetical protein LTSEBAI_2794 [Salmonella enterica subsp. enterica serovar Baildon str. R6-199]|nr:hypothetical protein LTSEBAI_2794 [Salmonella enterica subsp. enterica serovar Baildon str. R6-199]